MGSGERLNGIQEVSGSILFISTIEKSPVIEMITGLFPLSGVPQRGRFSIQAAFAEKRPYSCPISIGA